jgi:hypothetical protein
MLQSLAEHLLVFIDDATSMLMELRFVQSESTFSYFTALESYLLKHSRPVAFYSDKHTVFRVSKPNQHMTSMTQSGRALAELNIQILCANCSQTKGRVERANRTLQDRLVKELRLAGISNMDEGNAFLLGFTERFNAKFAKASAKPNNLHRPLNIEPDRLSEVFCLRDKRNVTKDIMLKYDRKRIKLEINELTHGLVGNYVDVYECGCGRIQVRSNGVVLPHTILNPERCSGTYQNRTRQGAAKGEGQTSQRQEWLQEDRSAPTWGSVQDGAILRPQTRRTRGPCSQPELRYLRSTLCQAALLSAPLVTLLLCAIGDISEWRLQTHW